MTIDSALRQKARRIKLLILDVDGVLTDGKICYTSDGKELKFFHVHDGLGIKRLQQTGVDVAIISSRDSVAVQTRMQELGIKHIYQGQKDKLTAFEKLLTDLQLTPEMTAFAGDDLPDLPVLERVGLAIAVKNAVDTVKKAADYQTKRSGGEGAVREICEMILSLQTHIWNRGS